MAAADPFDAVYADVESSVSALRAESSRRDAAAVADRLRALDWDLADLDEAVSVAASDPARFHLSPSKLSSRRRAVATLRDAVSVVAKEAEEAQAAARARGRDDLLGGRSDATVVQMDDQEDGARLQAHMVRQQDEGLHDLSEAVRRIGNIGSVMQSELAEQGEMLDQLDGDFDETRSRMANVQKRLDAFIADTSRSQLCTIALLFFFFITLTFLVFAT